jgi:hypothetical protein
MTDRDREDFLAHLRELKLTAATEALSLSEEDARGFILKETGRLMYHLQEVIEVIHTMEPEHPVANENVYLINPHDGITEYFESLSAITGKIYSTLREDYFGGDARELIQHHLGEYAETLTKLTGFLNGISLSEVMDGDGKRVF